VGFVNFSTRAVAICGVVAPRASAAFVSLDRRGKRGFQCGWYYSDKAILCRRAQLCDTLLHLG